MKKYLFVKRVVAFTIDWFIIFAVGISMFFIGPRFNVEYLIYPSIKMFSSYGIIISVIWFIAFPLLRDVLFKGSSIGKRLMRLRIYGSNDKEEKSIGKLILRNLTFYLPFLELLFLIVSKKTIGDMISSTYIVSV